jgi:ATP-binding cassette subfamily F protein 3
LSNLESKIQQQEKDLADIDHQLLMEYDQTIAAPGFFDAYQARKDELESLMEQWEEVSSQLESLE